MFGLSFRQMFWGPVSFYGAVWAVVALALDQAHKSYMLFRFWPGMGCDPFHAELARACKYVLTPNADLVMVWNYGISYGLFQQSSMMGRILLVAFAAVAIMALFAWLARTYAVLPAIAIGLVIGGAAGNAIDRAIYGGVADFFSLHAYNFYWYVFNVADAAIVAGVIGLLYDALFPSRKNVSNAS